MDDKEPYTFKLCRMCGKDLPPGGTRRIGICVWCVAAERSVVRQDIPRIRYSSEEEDGRDYDG